MVGPTLGFPSGNFGFLADHHPDLYELLSEAEVGSLRNGDDAGIRLRKFAERFVNHCSPVGNGNSNLQVGIDRLAEREVISAAEAERLHRLRTLGNRAAHEHRGLSYEEALDGLRHAHALVCWLVRREHAAEVSDFEVPRQAFTRLCEAAAKSEGRLRYLGFAARGSGPEAHIHELFVCCPLDCGGERLDARQLLEQLQDDPAAHVVVLGEAGAGKSTLARWLMHQLVAGGRPCAYVPATKLGQRIAGDHCSVLAAVHASLCARHEATLSVDAFAYLWKQAKSMLIIDGLDELGHDSDRALLGDALAAFGRDGNGVVVTSRASGYDRASLPSDFTIVRLQPWAEPERRSFLGLWFTRRELDACDVQGRVDELCDAIAHDHGANELAATPMLTTLIALLYESEGTLPTQLTSLYERSVKTMLRERPRTRAGYSERDMDEQLAWLEDIAALAADRGRAVAIADIVAQLQLLDAPGLPGQVGVEDWLKFLVEEAGLLVEFEPDGLDFSHATLRDHLCSRYLLRDPQRVAQLLLERAGRWSWLFPCVMTLHRTSLATVAEVIDRLDLAQCWGFIEYWAPSAELEPQVLTKLLEARARSLLEFVRSIDRAPGAWSSAHSVSNSLGHIDDVHQWLRERVATARGEALREVVTLAACEWPLPDVEQLLRARPDVSAVAEELLEFWPGTWLGALANAQRDTLDEHGRGFAAFIAAHVDDDGAARWAARAAPSDLLVVTLAGLTAPDTDWLARALIPRMMAFEADELRAWVGIVDGPSIPMPGCVRARLRQQSEPPQHHWTRRRMLHALAREQDPKGLRFVLPEFALTRAQFEAPRRALLDACPDQQLEGDFGWWIESIRELLPLRHDIYLLSACLAGPSTIEQMRARPSLEFVREPRARSCVNGRDTSDEQQQSEVVSIFTRLNEGPCARLDHYLQRVQAAELAIALLATRDASPETWVGYATWRLMIRWIAELWPAVEGRVHPLPVSTAKASLILALAWAVEQVTGRWPDSEFCVDLATVGFAGDPLFERMQELVVGLGQR